MSRSGKFINAMTQSHAHIFCRRILPKVSRTFAINIEILKGDLYKSVLCGYLFCRIIDTVEDSYSLTLDEQERLLDEMAYFFRSRTFDKTLITNWSQPFCRMNGFSPDVTLAQKANLVFENFSSLGSKPQEIIGHCVIEMAQGMKKTLAQKRSGKNKLYTLETLSDLETYCYYVAGTVGVLLTRLFIHYAGSMSDDSAKGLKERQVSFGLGLQLTNIIKDCFKDYKRGWFYIPVHLTQKHSIPIDRFFETEFQPKSMQVLEELIREAAKHLDEALTYTLLIPKSEVRIRLFCLWPLFFAIKTLKEAHRNTNLVTGEKPVKINRSDVYRTLLKTTPFVFSNSLLRNYYRSIRENIT